jgi:copper chaperone CopZ
MVINMKTQFKVSGIHCQGCISLIKLVLEENGFTDINLDVKTGLGSAVSDVTGAGEAKSKITDAFKEIPDYKVSGIEEA